MYAIYIARQRMTFKASDIDIDKLQAFEMTCIQMYAANQLERSQN